MIRMENFMQRPPNILFLMDDQHRFDWFGFAGHPIARTPNLDRIAKDGVIFDNAYQRGDVKYLIYGENPDWPEVLFDLEADPEETQNRAGMPEYAAALQAFRQRKEELGFL